MVNSSKRFGERSIILQLMTLYRYALFCATLTDVLFLVINLLE